MEKIRNLTFGFILFAGLFGFAAPLADSFGFGTVSTVSAQSKEVDDAGAKIQTSVEQMVRLVYDKLRLPASFLAAIIAIGVAMIYRRNGIPAMVGIFGFIFLWAFAPVIVRFLIGLAGGGGPIEIK